MSACSSTAFSTRRRPRYHQWRSSSASIDANSAASKRLLRSSGGGWEQIRARPAHPQDLGLRERLEHRERQLLAGPAGRFGELVVGPASERLLGWNGPRIVDGAGDARIAELRGERVAIGYADREHVVDARAIRALLRQADRDVEHLAVLGGSRPPGCVPAVEAGELGPQEGRLQAVEALVVTEPNVIALGELAEVAPAAGLLG